MRVLVTIPFTNAQKHRLSRYSNDVEYIKMADVQPHDVADKEVIIGNIPKSLCSTLKI